MLIFIEDLFLRDGLLEECNVYPSSKVEGTEVGSQLVIVVLPDWGIFSVVLLGFAKGLLDHIETLVLDPEGKWGGIWHSCLLPIRNLSSYASLASR